MMKKQSEIIISLIFLVVLFFCLDPFDWFMPSMLEMFLLVLLVLVFAAFATFVWKEGKGDEREVMHNMLAGRFAYLAGTTTLIVGIVVQSLEHKTDHWLIIALAIMVISKMIGLIYSQRKF